MKKTTLLITLLFIVQASFSQDNRSRIRINNANQSILNTLVNEGIDLRCGAKHEANSLTLEISQYEKLVLDQLGISYFVEIENLENFYGERAVSNLPQANLELQIEKARATSLNNNSLARSSVSSTTLDNYLQYAELNEKDWLVPTNFNLGSMGGCLTLGEMEAELDDMRTYSQTNGLNIVSVKQDASPTGQTTWGNPSGTISNNGLNYTGQGTTRWDPKTIYYVRITGNESSTSEGSKPQMLFTSMIHAREVSALMNNIYFMWYIIENYNTDPAVKNLVDNNELYFIPVVNPDGLRWNEHLDTVADGTVDDGGFMQRKNLRPSTGGTSNTTTTRGVDINRNFDYFWGNAGSGSSGTPSSDSYRGPSPHSEPETQIIEDFVLNRNFKTAIWNHSWANSIPHPYGGNPSFVSGREDEMHEMHADMTKYNRYVSGATIFSPSNGIADDWMLGGSNDANGSNGSGKNVLATTPEHGSEGFWPNPSSIVPIAKRSVRISLMGAYYGGKYAKFHDLTQSDISSLSSNLDFAIERIGQTASDFTLTVTPISANITNIVSPVAQTGMSVLEQRKVSASLTLNPGIQPNDKIEYNVQLSNDDGVFYNVDIEKFYQPTLLFSHNADNNGLTGWSNSGWSNSTSDAYSGSNALRTGNTVPYANGTTKTLTTSSTYDLSSSDVVLLQFYSKWDIERNFDFVELQASTNGTNWTTLNGKYTKPESSANTNDHAQKGTTDEAFQGNNASGHVYDGDQMDNWVMEEVVIDASYNSSFFGASNVSFRFRMRSDSNDIYENYSANGEGFFIDDFKIISLQIPCETTVPTNVVASNVSASTSDISWDNIPSATYDLRYKKIGTITWTELTDIATSTFTISDLDITTDYEVQVRSRCLSATSDYSASTNFTTTDLTYCDSSATDTGGQLSISDVTFNTIDNNNSSVALYSDFTSISTTISKNTTYSISITPRYVNAGIQNPVGYSVWIDYNKDGDFEDANEQVFTVSPIEGGNSVSGNITTPNNISNGSVRMRVSMKFNDIPDPCEYFSYGEVEDYTINLFNGLLYSGNNWTPNAPTVLTDTENIMIMDGVYSPTTNINVNNVEVASGAEINIDKANAITVNGDIENNGEFILNSDSNEFSSLLLTGTAIGNLKYNRHVNSNTNRNDLIAPPFSGQSFTDFRSNNSNIVSNPGETLYLFGPFDKAASDYLTYSNTEITNLEAGKGYRTASTDNSTFTFEGAVTTGNLNVPIFKSGSAFQQWNLIGNPYPTYIDLEDFLNANISQFDSESVAVYGYDADNTNGSYWTIWNLAYASANPNTLIAPGQGFFVSSKDGGGSIAFTPTMRESGASDDFIAGRNGQTSTISHSKLQLNSDSGVFDTDIYFTDNATLGLDPGYDAGHFGNGAPSFAIYSELVQDNEGIDLAVQAIGFNDVDNNAIIPLGINASQGQQLTISLTDNNLERDIYLEDALTNTFTLLNTSEYTFTPATNLADIGRFYLRFEEPTALSINDSNLNVLKVYSDNNQQKIVIRGILNSATKMIIYDMQGRQIMERNLEVNNVVNKVSSANFSSGVYLVNISNNTSTISKKIIVR